MPQPGWFFFASLSVLLAVSQTRTTLQPTGTRGRPRQPGQAPHPDLVSGHMRTKKHQGRLPEGVYRVDCGSERLAQWGLSSRSSGSITPPAWLPDGRILCGLSTSF